MAEKLIKTAITMLIAAGTEALNVIINIKGGAL